MGKYSKVIGAVVGLIVSFGAIHGFNLEFLQDPAVQGAVVTIVTMITSFVAPANA